ncbi:tetratricopeptide repeat protein [Bacillus cereus]|nr:tetratricopeptide repeat protein [Bacillus cereus]
MLGQRIKELRKQKKLTQEKLADGIITRSYLSQIEKGLIQPSYEVLEALSNKLNCSVEDFFDVVENKELTLSQIKKDIKAAENHTTANLWDKVKNFIEQKNYFNHPDVNKYDEGILNWIHGKYYEHIHDFNHAIPYFTKSISLLKEGNYVNELVRSLDSLGYLYSGINNHETALSTLNRAYKIIIHEQISGILRVSLLANLGIVHGRLSEYYSAINFLEEAIEQNEQTRTHYKAGEIYMALGICNMELQRFDQAKKANEKALKFFKLNENKLYEAGTYTNLGILSSYKKEFHQAQLSFKTALNLYTQNNAKPNEIMNVQVELARSYFAQKDYESAKSICFDTIETKSKNKHKAQAYELLGDIYLEEPNEELALKYYLEAKEIAEFISPNNKQVCRQICKKIGDCYVVLKDFEKSAYYYQECF